MRTVARVFLWSAGLLTVFALAVDWLPLIVPAGVALAAAFVFDVHAAHRADRDAEQVARIVERHHARQLGEG